MIRWLLVLLLLAGLGGTAWWYRHRQTVVPVSYEEVAVTRGDLTQLVTATGTLNPVTNVQVGSQISGNIQKLFADFNSSVKAGDIVAQLDPSTYRAVMHQAEGDLASARAALELAKLTARRKAELVQQKAAAQADADAAQAGLNQAEATVQIKKANLERAQVDLDRCSVYSPIDGTVISRAVDVGQTVAATMNAPVLFTIAKDLREMQIDSAVAEADVGNVEIGQTVEFYVDAFPYRTFSGKVQQVRNAATTVQNVVTYNVVIGVKNEDLKLKPGMTTNLSIIIAKREGVLKLPNAALRFRPPEPAGTPRVATPTPASPNLRRTGPRRGGGGPNAKGERNVYTRAEGTGEPEQTPVKLGISDGIQTEVLSGLEEGEKVLSGLVSTQTAGAPAGNAGGRPNNPIGGGMRFR